VFFLLFLLACLVHLCSTPRTEPLLLYCAASGLHGAGGPTAYSN
jgi:hypothetical protein